MAELHDTAHEVAESIALAKFVHVMAGLYIWEFILNLGHEYSIVMGKRKFIHTYPVGSSHAARAKDLIPRGTALHGVSLVHPIHRHITVRVP